jgi:hypothetical protein
MSLPAGVMDALEMQFIAARHVAAMNNSWMPKIMLNYRADG